MRRTASGPAGKHAAPGRTGVLGMVPPVSPLLLPVGDAAVLWGVR